MSFLPFLQIDLTCLLIQNAKGEEASNVVNTHDTCIAKENDAFYLFDEYKSDTVNGFKGFGCYSFSFLPPYFNKI